MQFGRRSERLDPDQFNLALEDLEQAVAESEAEQGITIDRATLAFWTGYAAAEVKPVWRLIREELLRSTKLFVDETTAPVLDPGRGRTKKGYFWVLARDDRPWSGRAPPAVVYSYAPDAVASTARRCCRAIRACCKPMAMLCIS
jgi:hypothetical protein